MVSHAKKIAAFTALLQENLNNWIANHGESLLALQQQLDDDDEKNAQAIESWLKEREDLYKQYEAKLARPKRTLSLSGEKGFAGIKAPGKDKSLAEQIEQAVKNNTNLETSAPSPEQDREKPQS
ncbi:hypothetical protein [Oscillatoria acuminata]|uniref:Uncharacterized protein n=1 Tax=Oscillatoria acuminata PCC 6304 TaxID=56110 RepID=K9TBZ7_9CYAN|nr:hypothetical protein [Oscillatoria acuminata]AFY79938.1 hypothetical protein Oscil6304_0184 [Oscillatoria acuminata PCC 6304]